MSVNSKIDMFRRAYEQGTCIGTSPTCPSVRILEMVAYLIAAEKQLAATQRTAKELSEVLREIQNEISEYDGDCTGNIPAGLVVSNIRDLCNSVVLSEDE